MNRRSFLRGILAAGTAPLVLSSGIARGIIMPVREIVVATPIVMPWSMRGVTESGDRIMYWGSATSGLWRINMDTGENKQLVIPPLENYENASFYSTISAFI